MTQESTTADYITARVQTTSFGTLTIEGRANITGIEGSGFSVRESGLLCGSQPIISFSTSGVRSIAMESDTYTAQNITTRLNIPQKNAIPTSRAIVNYCANARPPNPITHDSLTTSELIIEQHVDAVLAISGYCLLGNHMTPTRAQGTIQLPDAKISAGRLFEFIPELQQCLTIDGITTRGDVITFISDGARWFALDALGRKYQQ